tara:strand:+ start:298 stop:933 length:636 start_codon:yes stop_codon:yes gene_type:complete
MITTKQKCINEVKDFYSKGKGLTSTLLKNYTSGDGDNPGFEHLVESLVWQVVDDLGIDRKRVDIHSRYFQSDYSLSSVSDPQDPQRMDHHIKIDDKHPLIIESRAWIDKPFYTLKRAVTRNMMELPYVREQLTDDVQFAYVGLAIDVKDRLISSMNVTQGYGDIVNMFKFSPCRRSSDYNYFDKGVNEAGVTDFINFLYKTLSKYSKVSDA